MLGALPRAEHRDADALTIRYPALPSAMLMTLRSLPPTTGRIPAPPRCRSLVGGKQTPYRRLRAAKHLRRRWLPFTPRSLHRVQPLSTWAVSHGRTSADRPPAGPSSFCIIICMPLDSKQSAGRFSSSRCTNRQRRRLRDSSGQPPQATIHERSWSGPHRRRLASD